jgi:hypothetical protein
MATKKATEKTTKPDTAKTAKDLKDVIDAIEGVTKLEGELQQQLGKSEPLQRQQIADELANAVGARVTLMGKRRKLLESLKAQGA